MDYLGRLYASDFRLCIPPPQDQSRSLCLGPEIRVFADNSGRRRDLVEHPRNSKGLHQGPRRQGPTYASTHQAARPGLIPISFSTFVTLSSFPSFFELALLSALSLHALALDRDLPYSRLVRTLELVLLLHISPYILLRSDSYLLYYYPRLYPCFRTSYRRNERRLCLTHPDSVPAESSYVTRRSIPAVQ